MENNEKELLEQTAPVEENVEERRLTKEDFELVQSDVKIHDRKLDTKPTTFLKDAFKRFCKNKSSVVGAIILGILTLLAIIVPMVSNKDIKTVRKPEAFLAPKLFPAGTGFWDGTVDYERIVYDVDNQTPAGYLKNAVTKINVDSEPNLIEQASIYGHYGFIMLENENIAKKTDVSLYTKLVDFDKSKNYVYTFVLGDEDKITNKDLGEYQISIATAKQTLVKVEGNKVYWMRVGEDESKWRLLDNSLVEVKPFVSRDALEEDQVIEWRYTGGKYVKTDVKFADLFEGKDESVTIELRYSVEDNAVQYRLSDEGEFTTVVNPELSSIDARVNDETESIEWKFTSEPEAAYRTLESMANLDDGTGSKFTHYVLKEFSRQYGTFTINVSDKMTELGMEDVINGHLCFVLKAGDTRQYILIKEISATTSAVAPSEDATEAEKEEYQKVSDFINKTTFNDATQLVIREKDVDNYWYCTGRKGVHQSQLYYCDFTYDTYLAVFDTYDDITSNSEMDEYVRKGWLKYTFDRSTRTLTYEILSDECPIQEIYVDTIKVLPPMYRSFNVDCKMRTYAKYGYKTMPIFLFGTNASGNDLFKKAFAGLRTSLVLGICTAAFCFIFGLIWGSISGYFGGNVDLFMERFCDILSGVPWIVIMTLFILHLGNNFITFFLALCMTGWMGTAGRTRTQFYRFKGREYVLASRTLGSSDMRLIFRHILPNSLGTIITGSVLMIPSVIFSEATLAYLNLGLQNVPSFGVMMAENQKYLEKAPYLVVFPAVIIALMMISFNLFGNGLRDALNPSLKGSD